MLSFIPWVFKIPTDFHSGMIFSLVYGAGYVFLCNSIILKYSKKKPKNFVHILRTHMVVIGLLSAVIIELFANWIWKLWYYPHFSLPVYFFALFVVLVIYFVFILKGYLAVRSILLAHIKQKRIRKSGKSYHLFFSLIGLTGSIGFILGLARSISTIHVHGVAFFNSYATHDFNLINILLVSLSLVFILEYLEYKEHEDTLIMHLIQKDWVPLASILIASTLTSITMEGFNIPLTIWIYTNWPLANITFFNLPLTVLIAWPVQYILLIALYRVVYKRETARIWY
jgi:hypothetical protein